MFTETTPEGAVPPVAKPRGFAMLDPEKRREISRRGGIAAHAKGTAHEFTTDEARAAGRKGGQVTKERRASKPESEPAPTTH